MAELTNEQLDRATDAYRNFSGGSSVELTSSEIARCRMRAAAPFIQLPWDEPTEDEAMVIHSTDLGMSLTATFDQCKWNVLHAFVRDRNATLRPKPIDPRIDLIDRTLCDFMNSLNNTEERTKAAKAILTVLDEVGK